MRNDGYLLKGSCGCSIYVTVCKNIHASLYYDRKCLCVMLKWSMGCVYVAPYYPSAHSTINASQFSHSLNLPTQAPMQNASLLILVCCSLGALECTASFLEDTLAVRKSLTWTRSLHVHLAPKPTTATNRWQQNCPLASCMTCSLCVGLVHKVHSRPIYKSISES